MRPTAGIQPWISVTIFSEIFCLLVCLFVCLLVCLFVCLLGCLFVCLLACSFDVTARVVHNVENKTSFWLKIWKIHKTTYLAFDLAGELNDLSQFWLLCTPMGFWGLKSDLEVTKVMTRGHQVKKWPFPNFGWFALLWGSGVSKVTLRSPRSWPKVTRSKNDLFPILADSCS